MEKEGRYQLELFSQTESQSSQKKEFSNAFLGFIRAYEKALLISIGLLTTGVVSFSLGVEKGKKLMISKENSYPDIAIITKSQRYQPQSTEPNIQGNASQKNPAQTIIKKEPKEDTDNYTIQIASYRTKNHAQEEAETLKRRGLPSFVISKGKFSAVCVGNFPKQESARPLLTELKKAYRDCYIRRL